jgi:HK97 family phage prohead protease
MGAIGVHHTDTVDTAWDGPAAKAHLKNDGTQAYYRSAFAWEDPDGDGTKKSDFKFIHHEVDSDGKVGAANLRACSSGIAILNGGRGGANIPEADRKGVHAHLAAHLKDAKKDVPELKSSSAGGLERRMLDGSLQVIRKRAAGGDEGIQQPPMMAGYAAKFGTRSLPLGFGFMAFREQIDPHAFDQTLASAPDVRFTFNHDANQVFGRTTSGTLKLAVDSTGLHFDCEPPDNQAARDLMASIERGDISQCSFAFRVLDDDWNEEKDGTLVRTLKKVSLHDGDVAAVTYPAYPDTDVNVRALDQLVAEGRRRLMDDGVIPRSEGAARAAALRRRAELEALE